MSDYESASRELTVQAAGLPHGPAQVALWEQAIAVADAHRDDALGFDLRSDALWPMYHGNRAELLLVTYAWCLAYLDRTPDEDPDVLLWSYRWVIDVMPNFPAFPRPQIDAAWQDMKTRYAANGYSPRPVWLNRRLHLVAMGDEAGAADAHRRFARTRPGYLSDDTEQDAAFAVSYAVFRRRDKAAVAAAAPFLSGAVREPAMRIGTLNRLLLPLARLGRAADARTLLNEADRLTRTRPQYLGKADEPLTFLAAVGDLAGAVRHFDRHFAAAMALPGEFRRVGDYKHALFLARELVRHGRKPALKVPAGLVPGVEGTRTPPGPLRDWLEVALPDLCRRADVRNGNSYYTDRLDDLDGYARLTRKLARVT